MSMEHQAYLFDYAGFTSSLGRILYEALDGDLDALVRFIEGSRDRLSDPSEGMPLNERWQDRVEPEDAHQLGDLALTAFYSPRQDVGLGYTWQEALHDAELEGMGDSRAVVLGEPFGPPGNPFDPGKMGSYFRSWGTVHTQRQAITTATANGVHSEAVLDIQRMLTRADKAGRGLYVTF